MANIQCPKCGEEYSDTYRSCPFCQEAEAQAKGKPIRRKGKRLDKKKRSGGAGGIILLLAVVIVFGVVGYVFFGEQVAGLAGIRTDDDRGDLSQLADGDKDAANEDQQPAQDDSQQGETTPADDTAAEPAGPLALDFDVITISAGQTARITATGGTGDVTWSSSNANIASVDGGSVTGLAGGTVTITAQAGEESVSCTVNVDGDPWVSNVSLSLNKTDVTVKSGDPTFTLKVKGGDHGSVTWASKNSGVASVTSEGVVKREGKGTTAITATVDGHVLECIIRCP